MKKKKKKTLIFIAIAVVVALGATAAYAWWTSTGSLGGNSIDTGTMAIEVQGQSGPINVAGLMPSYGPAINLGAPFALSTQVLASEDNFPSRFFWIHNSGNVPEMFYAWAEVTGNTWIADKVMCRIWLDPRDYPGGINGAWWKAEANREFGVWQGPLSDIDSWTEGRDRIRTITPDNVMETLPAGTSAVYKIVFWLDSSAGNSYQTQHVEVTLHVEGGQAEAWGSW